MANSEKATDLVSRAYKLGYEIGFYGHYETLGWIRRERAEIDKLAKKLGIVKYVLASYEKGRKRGLEAKRSSLSGSAGGKVEAKEEELPELEYEPDRKRRPSVAHVKPGVLIAPDLMRMGELMEMPRFLKRTGPG